jgi:4-hydroxybenzoate polyprenyltransferase
MDINDRVGDKAAGVPTLPVVFGSKQSLAVAASFLLAGTVVGFKGLHASAAIDMLAQVTGMAAFPLEVLIKLLLLLGVFPAWVSVNDILRSELDPNVVSRAIGNSLKPIAVGLLLLTFVR